MYSSTSIRRGSFFFFCLLCQIGLAQQFYFKQYTPDDGLPSAYLYNIVQDEKGFLWIASEAEVCKFDGNQFMKSNIKGLEKKEIIRIYFHKPNRLWFADLKNQLYVYEKDSLYQIDKSWYPQGNFLNSIHQDKNNHIWILSQGNDVVDVVKVAANQILNTKAYLTYSDYKIRALKLFYAHSPDTSYIITPWWAAEFLPDTTLMYSQPIKEGAIEGFGNSGIGMPSGREVLIYTFGGDLVVFSVDTKKIRPVFPEYRDYTRQGINNLFKDHLDNIWISTRNGLLFLEKQQEDSYKMSIHLEGSNVGGVFQDEKLNYWVTTLTDGLFLLPSTEVKIYQHPRWKKNTAIGENENGNIIIGTEGSQIIALDDEMKLLHEQKIQLKSMRVYDIDSYKDKLYVSCSSQIMEIDEDWNSRSICKGAIKQIEVHENGRIWVGRGTSMGYIENDSMVFLGRKRTYAVFPLDTNACYFGTIDGLYLYENENLRKVAPDLIKEDIRHLAILEDSTLCLTTQGNGLILMKDGEIINHFTTENGLLSNNCKQSLVHDNMIWLASNKGLHRIDLENDRIHVLTKNNGLPDNEVNFLYQKGDTIIAATNNGVAYFDQSIELEEFSPKLYFSSIKVLDKDTIVLPSYQLKYAQNDIKIGFAAIQFRNANLVEYQYKLDGLNANWVDSKITEAQYPSLSSGEYVFSVRAKTINSDWSKPLQFEFEVTPPIWKKWWFILLALFLSILFIYLIIWSIIERNKEQNKIQTQIKESQLQALRVQMNPHFLFNSLNSIQEFIMLQDKRTANRYLGQFSKLMRKILNMSDKEYIPLEEEVEALELYLSLESMRFEEAFDYEIDLNECIDASKLTIPPMLVQPYVENAILHGLNPKQGQKKLTIRFWCENNLLFCSVEDNGIGRQQAIIIKQKKEKKYLSKGMGLTEKRLKLLNSTLQQKLSVKIIDLKDEAGLAAGTKIILQIMSNQKTKT